MRVQVVAFDLDDTLLDWSAAIARALDGLIDQAARERFHTAVERDAWHRRDGFVCSRRHWRTVQDPHHFLRAALDGTASDAEIDELALAYRARLAFECFDDVTSTLDALDGRVRLAMLSNAPRARERAEQAGILDRFEVALSAPAEMRKPHPGAFDLLLGELGCRAYEVAYVGDDVAEDVEGSLRRGLTSIWIDRMDSGWEPPPPGRRITTLAEIPEILEI